MTGKDELEWRESVSASLGIPLSELVVYQDDPDMEGLRGPENPTDEPDEDLSELLG